eukprot:TRINITY_DN1214_c0_g1_i6.p1 TRINITY_DN1214_c0_g1~~TRINITY_DN1214_c0_g1_i6.p1  ORF type:complete len:385 (-),score=68.20 TRINITY_DN1214_c0_g1_i6:28-1182(-)
MLRTMKPNTKMTKKPIALVFDINRTILIEDKAAGKTRKEEICSVLASCCHGRIVNNCWQPNLAHPVQYTPQPEHVSYYHYVQEHLYPFPRSYPEGTTTQEKHKVISQIKDDRRDLLKQFFKLGHPGTGWIEEYHKLVQATEQPEGFTLLPSFYETVSHFRREGQPISLCFRTFGEDLKYVRKEWNSFCSGGHPDFPQFNDEHLILSEKNMGAFYRRGPNSDDCYLIMGTIKQPKISEDMTFYEDQDLEIYHGFQEIDRLFQSKYKRQEIFAVRDYYPWWASQGERSDSGKLLFVGDESENPHSSRVRQFFFDDNLWVENYQKRNQFIVDIREAGTGNTHPNIERLLGSSCFQAQPLYAISQRKYFVDLITKTQERDEAKYASKL